jgi:DNA repair exonuclease SbcCD ATPase subunit
VEPRDFEVFQLLAKKQESIASKCGESNTCDRVYFTRGLLALYESREMAEKYFEKVVAVAPQSQFAVSSKAWLQLLQEPAAPGPKSWSEAVLIAPAVAKANSSSTLVIDRLVRDLLDEETAIQQIRSSKDGDSQTVEALQRELAQRDQQIGTLSSKKESPTTVQNLQKQLAERDRKIEELSTQLQALKRIDQEMREKARPIRPPLTTVPVPGPEPAP